MDLDRLRFIAAIGGAVAIPSAPDDAAGSGNAEEGSTGLPPCLQGMQQCQAVGAHRQATRKKENRSEEWIEHMRGEREKKRVRAELAKKDEEMARHKRSLQLATIAFPGLRKLTRTSKQDAPPEVKAALMQQLAMKATQKDDASRLSQARAAMVVAGAVQTLSRQACNDILYGDEKAIGDPHRGVAYIHMYDETAHRIRRHWPKALQSIPGFRTPSSPLSMQVMVGNGENAEIG